MAFQGLQSFIDLLEKSDELIRVKEFVDPRLEITEITDRISKQAGGGKAILFENTGTGFPVLINALGSEKRIALAFGRESVFQVEKEIEALFVDLMSPKDNLWDKLRLLPRLKDVSEWMPKKRKGKGVCQEIIINDPDLTKLPVLTCWPADGGPFVTLPGVHTVDPETQTPNVGMYRMQIFEKNLTGMHWHRHKTGANHFEKYKKLNKKMPIAVALGGDPVYTYAATAPMPENVDEYLLAGFLRKKAVKLVKCVTNNLYVPEDADFVIEGYVDPAEDFIWEGPFGDHTGFYSLADWYPKFHVTCITHRKDAVYPATIVGVPPMEDAYIGLATERIFLSPIRMAMVPELKDMTLPVAGVAHNFTVVKIKKSYPGQAVKVMNSLWGAGQMMFNKVLVVVDESVDIQNYHEVLKAFTENFNASYSLHFSKGPLDVLDHSSQKFAFGSKLGIDLTSPFPEEKADEILSKKTAFDPAQLEHVQGLVTSKIHEAIQTLLLTVKKDKTFDKKAFSERLSKLENINQFRFILIFNEGVDLEDPFILFWLLGGNLEPDRDITILPEKENTILIDVTFKTGEHDNFRREWPNIVTMDDKTIASIDEKWESLGLGKLVESPSNKLKPLVKGDGAVRS
ncbi:MAG TPA: menaquinone biosynthesis decarboxylase [Draconibacterium sp.]|nr:menaquinone biosynthesis decarboxylase [Draconibacterium sp.]